MRQIGRFLTLLALYVLLFAGTLAYGQFTSRVIRVDIPFDFTIEQTDFPAGQYSFLINGPNSLLLRDSNGRSLITVGTRSVQANSVPRVPKLSFKVEGSRHLLSQIWRDDSAIGYELDL
ncbi:MAG TPA: hypothetical protein VH744_04810, partial [Terriglobales bacterium]